MCRCDFACTTTLGPVVSSPTGTPQRSATASRSTRRACAPARRSGMKYPGVERLAPVICAPPKPGLPYARPSGAWSTFTLPHSASSSSAMSRGMPVMAPWPISMAGATMVIVPSAAIVTQMLGEKPPAWASARARRPVSVNVKVRAAADPATKARRETVMAILGLLCRTLDGAHDASIRPAAAQVAVHGLDDLLTRGLRRLRQQRGRLHDLARLTIAALQHLQLDPRLLQRMAGAVGGKAFDRRD